MQVSDTTDSAPAKTEVTYKVTVTKIVKNFPFRNREYKKFSDDEDDDNYGYVYFDDTKDINTTVYEQTIDEVDMPSVIKAVNKMDSSNVTQ